MSPSGSSVMCARSASNRRTFARLMARMRKGTSPVTIGSTWRKLKLSPTVASFGKERSVRKRRMPSGEANTTRPSLWNCQKRRERARDSTGARIDSASASG